MIQNIFAKNFVLIEELSLDFANRLNVITGETGAGKSIILSAVDFCINGAGGKEIIRHGNASAICSCTFDAPEKIRSILKENNIEISDGEDIIISRQIGLDGKKRITINSQPTTQKILDLIADDLVIIYGQHSFGQLFKTSLHIKILDSFVDDKALFAQVKEKYNFIKKLQDELASLKETAAKSEQEADYLKHVVSEIADAKISATEEAELSSIRLNLQQNIKKTEFLCALRDEFESSNISANLSSISRTIARSNQTDLSNLSDEVEKALEHIGTAEEILYSLIREEDANYNIDEIEERLFFIRSLARKYNILPSEIPNYLEESEKQLDSFNACDSEILRLEKEISKLQGEYLLLSNNLSETRRKAGADVEKLVLNELTELDMKLCRFKVDIVSSCDKFSENGIDSVSFMAATNPGNPFSTIDKVASGGEMARFMLALQVALMKKNYSNASVIFDEVDTGIGGAVAESVGLRLKELGNYQQVIAITHQPQVASKSDMHIKVSKEQTEISTKSTAKILTPQEREKEIARMLSGRIITDAAKEAARSMIHTS